MDAKARRNEAISNANLNNPSSMRDLFNATATYLYHANTKQQKLRRKNRNWAASCIRRKWNSIDECVLCAEESVLLYLADEFDKAIA